ncbi:hypothetical protein CAEBREN_16005 [Caenorhabditis brenneri]|uniref:Uncharacterized protein n=1 Tax=Caenorhabditis brenneri TaxID=135651 RepID=G0NNA8_CAEBE|nr:hypothetical protein CAEBREN_16005 [Caenorhabditis brenneri]
MEEEIQPEVPAIQNLCKSETNEQDSHSDIAVLSFEFGFQLRIADNLIDRYKYVPSFSHLVLSLKDHGECFLLELSSIRKQLIKKFELLDLKDCQKFIEENQWKKNEKKKSKQIKINVISLLEEILNPQSLSILESLAIQGEGVVFSQGWINQIHGTFPSLTLLDLSGCHLLPKEFNLLCETQKNLKSLFIGKTGVYDLSRIDALSKLEVLSLENLKFKSLASFQNALLLENLVFLDISSNRKKRATTAQLMLLLERVFYLLENELEEQNMSDLKNLSQSLSAVLKYYKHSTASYMLVLDCFMLMFSNDDILQSFGQNEIEEAVTAITIRIGATDWYQTKRLIRPPNYIYFWETPPTYQLFTTGVELLVNTKLLKNNENLRRTACIVLVKTIAGKCRSDDKSILLCSPFLLANKELLQSPENFTSEEIGNLKIIFYHTIKNAQANMIPMLLSFLTFLLSLDSTPFCYEFVILIKVIEWLYLPTTPEHSINQCHTVKNLLYGRMNHQMRVEILRSANYEWKQISKMRPAPNSYTQQAFLEVLLQIYKMQIDGEPIFKPYSHWELEEFITEIEILIGRYEEAHVRNGVFEYIHENAEDHIVKHWAGYIDAAIKDKTPVVNQTNRRRVFCRFLWK